MARQYPLGLLIDEARIVSQRINAQMVSESILTQNAVSSLLSKKGGSLYSRTIKRLLRR